MHLKAKDSVTMLSISLLSEKQPNHSAPCHEKSQYGYCSKLNKCQSALVTSSDAQSTRLP